VQPVVLAEDDALLRLDRERRPQPPVLRVGGGVEHGEPVGAAGDEDGEEDAPAAQRGSARDPVVELRRPQRGGAVDDEPETGGTGEERAPVEARPGGKRHARLDRRETASGLGRRAVRDQRAAVLAAVVTAVRH
jgi:hypothetical protein